MNVQGFGHTHHADSRQHSVTRTKSSKADATRSAFSISDKVEISSQNSSERFEIIQQVKKKIKAGYYATEPVIEDLSHGFAKILNQL
ncbi:MAG: hypothetical protein JW768_10500 [Chitinispirillaceae bacterium]|nr:hypothetical protein [Chitinispirillaceae bacterium]